VEAKIKLKNSGPRNREREENKKTPTRSEKTRKNTRGGKRVYIV